MNFLFITPNIIIIHIQLFFDGKIPDYLKFTELKKLI